MPRTVKKGHRRWVLRTQMLEFSSERDAIDLLYFPNPNTESEERVTLRVNQGGKEKCISDTLPEAINQINGLRFHQLQAKRIGLKLNCPDEVVITAIHSYVTISPRSRLWAPVKSCPMPKSPRSQSVRLTYASMESHVFLNQLRSYPTIFETHFEVNSSLDAEQTLDVLADVVCSAIPVHVRNRQIVCVADLYESAMDTNILEELAPNAVLVDQLDTRFDRLHMIMVGSQEICGRLFAALGSQAPVTMRTVSGMCVVRIPKRVVRHPHLVQAASPCLVAMDEKNASGSF